MARGTAVRSRGNPRQMARNTRTIQAGPLVGMRDSLDPMLSNDPSRALLTENMVPLELDKPSVFVGRPGLRRAGLQLGAVNKRTGQLVYQFTKLDGTEYTIAVVGGQGIYSYDWGTNTWTLVVTVANLSGAGITLSETTRCYGLTFTDELHFSDGTNTPFLWDGTTGGGLTLLTNSPVLFGQPSIYFAKIFGIKATEPNVAVWCEENDATIGYEQAAYLNTWRLTQTEQERFYAFVGTNDRLYSFRRGSTGAVSGPVTPEFRTDGTNEGVSQTIGTLSPSCMVKVGSRIFFLDERGRPHYTLGNEVVPAWQDIAENLGTIDVTQLSKAIGLYDPQTQLVLFGLVELGQSNPSMIIVFNPVLNVPVSIWRGFTFTAMAVVKDADGDSVLMHLSEDGYAYYHGLNTGDLWDDELAEGTASIRHTVETAHLGAAIREEKRWLRTDVTFRADGEATAIGLTCATPYGDSASQTLSITGASARWDQVNWDEFDWTSESVQQHVAFGLNELGRWARQRISHEQPGERFGFEALVAEYAPGGDPMAAR